jgi:antitoxin HigA-1
MVNYYSLEYRRKRRFINRLSLKEASMVPENCDTIHPGEILLEEFLKPLGLTQVAFAKHIGVPVQRINEIVLGKRRITPETAWLLAQAFGTSPELWLNLQTTYDLARFRPKRQVTRIAAAAQ